MRLCEDMIKPHGEVFKRIGCHLKGTDKLVIYICPRDSNIKLWDDSYFRGNWLTEEAIYDSDMARSCLVCVVSYLGCPNMWKFQLKMELYLSSTESDYITLIQDLHKNIPIVEILK